MTTLAEISPRFVEVAHRIVWATVATVDRVGRPRSRILHPVWETDGDALVGWIGTAPTPVKLDHLANSSYVSVNYWDQQQDVATAECAATIHDDDDTCVRVWNLLKDAPEPVGYDPTIIPGWEQPTDASFVALRLDPWRLRVFPGSMLLTGSGEILDWHAP